jgi:hypothetical protein
VEFHVGDRVRVLVKPSSFGGLVGVVVRADPTRNAVSVKFNRRLRYKPKLKRTFCFYRESLRRVATPRRHGVAEGGGWSS